MKVLCVHHKGGVGKTTTAIHITGVFLGNGDRVILIDSDSQADSFKFFSEGASPQPGGQRLLTQENMLMVVSEGNGSNSKRFTESLKKLSNDKSFNHIVVDIATDLPNISNILFEIKPDLVLVGVKRDDVGSFVHLNDMLLALEQARPIIASPLRVKVIPIGVQQSEFQEFVDKRFSGYEVLKPVDWLPMKAGKAVFVNFDYLWNEPGCEHLWEYYQKVVME
jgi:cellulose biosynthesis protein BcsQ